jgi:hypothetical protein
MCDFKSVYKHEAFIETVWTFTVDSGKSGFPEQRTITEYRKRRKSRNTKGGGHG